MAEAEALPTGLTEQEVEARRAKGMGNDFPFTSSRTYVDILRENVFTFINNVLFLLGIALVVLGRPSDALISVGVAMLNVLVGVVQEVRAKRTLDRIALLTRPKATVMREGTEREIDPSGIVIGDVVIAEPGDQVVVDGEVLVGSIEADESLLTGESDRVPKGKGDPVYSGSFAVTGRVLYEAQKVGAESLANKLTASARSFRRVLTPLQSDINIIIRVILLVAVYFEIMLAISSVISDTPLVESVKNSVVIAGLVPNGLILAIAVAYALGAVRMVGKGALVQQSNAVESLSNVDVLCLDKTGTLTSNRLCYHDMHVLSSDDGNAPRGEAADPGPSTPDEIARALAVFAASVVAKNKTSEALAEAFPAEASPSEEIPFDSVRKWSALMFEGPDIKGTYVLGAPEMLADRLTDRSARWDKAEEWMAGGLRVLLFAWSDRRIEQGANGPQLPAGLRPLCLVALSDELRQEAKETLAAFTKAGVSLKIISGDNPHTVAALAKQAGLEGPLEIVSGSELREMDEAQFAQAAQRATIFGRIMPEQKEQIVRCLRVAGHYVAMIGDGVNDVLSLKQANLGVAMQSGSQATRKVADIVLLEDSFAALPRAVQEGQRIINGMVDILQVFLTRVLYASLLILSATAIGGFPFTPKQNALLALLTVGIPTIALATWARPGPSQRRTMMRRVFHFVAPAAVTIGVFAFGIFVAYLAWRYQVVGAVQGQVISLDNLDVAQNATTTFCIFCGLLILPFAEPPIRLFTGGDRLAGDWKPAILAAVMLVIYILILSIAPLRAFFELTLLPVGDYVLLALAAVVWAILLRWIWRFRLLERFLNIDLAK